jgi:hypothetical protein
MSHFQQHQEFFDKPIRLSEDEENDPIKVIEEFFTDYRLSEIREINEETNRVCLTSDIPPFQDPEERDRLISFREREEKLIEAASLLLLSRQTNNQALSTGEYDKAPNVISDEAMALPDLQKKVVDIQRKVAELGKIVLKSWGLIS